MNIENKIASEEEVGKRIAARLAAEDFYKLAVEEGETHGDVFWEKLHKMVCRHVKCPKEESTRKFVMDKQEAVQFGNEVMPFGGYVGKRVDDVPLERLWWYADQSFIDDLRRYLRSKRVQSETV